LYLHHLNSASLSNPLNSELWEGAEFVALWAIAVKAAVPFELNSGIQIALSHVVKRRAAHKHIWWKPIRPPAKQAGNCLPCEIAILWDVIVSESTRSKCAPVEGKYGNPGISIQSS
jgi:hypothetical protein